MNIFVTIILLFILWIICNGIVKILLNRYTDLNELVVASVKYRKTIMFDLIIVLFLYFLDINFLNYIAIVYYIIIIFVEGFLLVISVITGITEKTDKITNNSLWLLTVSKALNELAKILVLIKIIALLN